MGEANERDSRLQDNRLEEISADDAVPLPSSSSSARPSSGTQRTAVNTAPISSFFSRPPSSPFPSLAQQATPPALFKPHLNNGASSSSSRAAILSNLGGHSGNSARTINASTNAASGSGRQLPANMLPAAAGASLTSQKNLPILNPGQARPNPLLTTVSRSIPSSAGSGGIPVISGAHARTPSSMLPGQRPTSNGLAALPTIPRIKQESVALPSSSSSSAARSAPAGVKKESQVIDLTLSDDDEPKIVSVSKTEPEVMIDADKMRAVDEQIVCLGMVRANMMIPGLSIPLHMVCEDGTHRSWFDQFYDGDHWPPIGNMPRGSAFWTEPGYRPVHIEINHRPVKQVPTGQVIGDKWQTREEVSTTPEAYVLSVVSPAHALEIDKQSTPRGAQPPQLGSPRIADKFGQLYDRPAVMFANLQFAGKCGLESRMRVIPRSRTGSPFHQVETNIFVPRGRALQVIMSFRQQGLYFERPSAYDQTDYPSNPPLLTEHLTAFTTPTIYQLPSVGQGSSVSFTAAEAQEEARKQVDQVYTALRAGEDLPAAEAGRLLKTALFPHQKQALSFLLDREKERSWEEESDDEGDEAGPSSASRSSKASKNSGPSERLKAQILSDDEMEVDVKEARKGKQKAKSTKPDEGRVVSLWRAEKSSLDGQIRKWTNVVTNQKQSHRPQICRGAILADDMGLGKTISIIALMTRTWDEAEAFGQSEVTTLDDLDLPEEDEEEDEEAGLTSFNYPNMPRPRPKGKKGKKEKKWREQERVRISNLETRSRATLIICPLTVVPNWIEQINEHWVDKKKPKMYTYHGPNRNQNIAFLAKHDVIITTYSTLAYEFGRSNTWADDDEAAESIEQTLSSLANGSKKKDDDSDDDEEFVMYDAAGNRIGNSSSTSTKKRKKGTRKEAFNPLQRIEFFRVVLDESHMIKETSTLQSKAVCNLSAQRRLSLTGTPIQNKLDDLYSQFKFLRLDPFHKKSVWTKYCMHNSRISLRTRKDAQSVDSIGLARIQTIMKAVALRRTKDSKDANGEPILKLPPKANRIVTLEFDEHERAKYEAMRHRYKEDFEQMVAEQSVGKNYASILVEINALRLTCDDATLVDFGKDMKRLKEGKDDLVAAIREDGLSPDRAAQLFKVFCDCDQGNCYDCERDLSNKLEAEDEDIEEEVPKKRGPKKARTSKAPIAADGEVKVNPVITRCQHLFCVDCFSRKLGASWISPKADTKAPCPQCNESLTVTLDAIELDHDIIREALESHNRKRGGDSDSDETTDDEFDDYASTSDSDDEEEDDDNRAWKPKRRPSRRQVLKDEDEEDNDEAAEAKPKLAEVTNEQKEQKKGSMSSKVRALLAELEPFSKCNPSSTLYDRRAPRLDHYAPPKPKTENGTDEDEKPATANGDQAQAKDAIGLPDAPSSTPAFEPVQIVSLPPLADLDHEAAEVARKAPPIKSVVFSQWTRMLDRIAKALDKKGIRFARLDGSMTRIQRTNALDAFKSNPRVEVMLISLRAGGFGLNLVSACRAYLIDPYWNPAVENQGLDRIYRLGQQKPVVLTRFIMKKSIEENMLELQKRKMELAEQVGKRRVPQTAAERRSERERDLRDLLR
ncbi:hypothetical protein OC846_001820 [Tilletia horrida]|uniref:DNA repair protein RAD5 n=1 Tax=Tilletia horrida TaxID=155126 RepID=A0AAN6JVK1_9BASI|nr:hypothetical protein OC846_001820 [Tilletia horrida]